jgi:hypothetical protein
VRELRGFERVSLEPGETRRVTLRVPSEQLKYHGVDYATGGVTGRILEPHELQIQVGPNSRAASLKDNIHVR